MSRLILTLIIFGLGGLAWYALHDFHPLEKPETWQMAYEPGKLSKAHLFLSHQCTTCHTPGKGVKAIGCATCHADDQKLLKRQPTAFHAHITSCQECHREHQGGEKPPLVMDHAALAKLGIEIEKSKMIPEPDGFKKEMKIWRETTKEENKLTRVNPHDSALVSKLNCIACHGNQDRHRRLFGTNCLSCHSTQTWRIAEYRHPSVNSRDCAQCHQAPPSHYMEHFQMVSEKVAGKEHVQVNQCFLCHKTTSWNDIQGVGWYKHH